MDHLALKKNVTPAFHDHGVVVAKEDGTYTIQIDSGEIKAERAFGCVVEPVLDDLVLVSCGENGRAFILNILERTTQSRAELSFQDDVLIRSEDGNISVSAKEELNLTASGQVGMVSPKIHAAAAQADFHIDRTSYFGSFLQGKISVVKVIAESMQSFCKRLTSLCQTSFRQVEQTDQVRCAHLDYQAESLMHLQGEYARVEAEEDVHIGGERINIG